MGGSLNQSEWSHQYVEALCTNLKSDFLTVYLQIDLLLFYCSLKYFRFTFLKIPRGEEREMLAFYFVIFGKMLALTLLHIR